jgi:hypothetical protein
MKFNNQNKILKNILQDITPQNNKPKHLDGLKIFIKVIFNI